MGDADPRADVDASAAQDELVSQQAVMVRHGLQHAPRRGLQRQPGGGAEPVPWPLDLSTAPLIVDTDIGSDADDAVALALAARGVAELALVTTGDETGSRAGGYGQRARAARWLLDACGRAEVPVAAGAALDDIDHFVLAGAIPSHVPQLVTGQDVVDAVVAVADSHRGPLRWVGIAPMTNLARVIKERPDVAARLHVTQMGAAVNYRDPDRAEHNVRLDLDAAREVLAAARERRLASLELVTSDVTFTDAIALGPEQALCRGLAGQQTAWEQMLHVSLTRWFSHPRGYDHSMQHDALTLSAALELPFVESIPAHVALDDIGRLVYLNRDTHDGVNEGAHAALVAQRADYSSFMRWLERGLAREVPAGARVGASDEPARAGA